jgi:hypothetical protein
MFVPFHVMEHEDLAGSPGQLIHRSLDRHSKVGTTRHRGRLHLSLHRGHKSRFPRPPGFPAPDQMVHGHAVEPGRERRRTRKRTQLLPYPNENLLNLVVDVISPQEPPRERVHPSSNASASPRAAAGTSTVSGGSTRAGIDLFRAASPRRCPGARGIGYGRRRERWKGRAPIGAGSAARPRQMTGVDRVMLQGLTSIYHIDIIELSHNGVTDDA